MAPTLEDRWDALLALAEAALPGWLVERGPAQAARPVALVEPTEWQPPAPSWGQAGGAQEWSIRLLAAEAPLPAGRASALSGAGNALLAALAGASLATLHGPLEPVGGGPVVERGRLAAWELRLRESLPPANAATPVLATSLVLARVLSVGMATGTDIVPGVVAGDGVAVGDALVISSGGGASREHLGRVTALKAEGAVVERKASATWLSGASVHRLAGATFLPVTRAPGSALGHDLPTALQAGGDDPPAIARADTRRFGPLPRAVAESAAIALGALSPGATVIVGGEDGALSAATLVESLRVEARGAGLALLEARLHHRGNPFAPTALPEAAPLATADVLEARTIATRALNGGGSSIAAGDAVVWSALGEVSKAPNLIGLSGPYGGVALEAAAVGEQLLVAVAGIADTTTSAALSAGQAVHWNGSEMVLSTAGVKAHAGIALHATAGSGAAALRIALQPRFNP